MCQEPFLGVINGRATSLPKPAYPKHLQDLCAEGRVEVELLLDERGKVLETTPLSGDELLYEVAQEAAKLARFSRPLSQNVRSKGIVVYNFVPETKCIDAGNIFGKWLKKPSFSIHPHLIIEEEREILLRIGINPFTGEVVAAKAIGGHPISGKTLEAEAMKLKFRPAMINAPYFNVKGFFKLKVKKDRTVTPVL